MSTREISDGELHSAAPGLQAEGRRTELEASSIVCKIKPIIASEYPTAVINLLRTATKSIDICAYCWKWYSHRTGSPMQRINYAIIEKARCRLPIRVRLNSEAKDHYLTKENSRTAVALGRYPIEIKFDHSKTMSHLKMIIIDKEIAILGSHNLSERSVSQNNEASVIIIGREAVQIYSDYFERLWKNQL